jgi:hypothetical protein
VSVELNAALRVLLTERSRLAEEKSSRQPISFIYGEGIVRDEKNDSYGFMKTLPKWVLALAVANLIVGVFVTMSHSYVAFIGYLALPLSVIFTGLFLVTLALQNEAVKFAEGERLKMEPAKIHGCSAKGKERTEASSNALGGSSRTRKASFTTCRTAACGACCFGIHGDRWMRRAI